MAQKIHPEPVLPKHNAKVPSSLADMSRLHDQLISATFNELRAHAQRLNSTLPGDGSEPLTGPLKLWPKAKADLPDPIAWASAILYVTDEVGGAVPAFSDGVNWRRFTDRAIVS